MNRRGQSQRWFSIGVIFMMVLTALPGASAVTAAPLASFIVQSGSAAQAAQLAQAAGGQVTSNLDVINAVAVQIDPAAAQRLKSTAGVRAVYPNSSVQMVGDWDNDGHEAGGKGSKVPATDYPDVTGADLVWQKNDNGAGVTVAVLDTGIALHRGLVRTVNNRFGHIIGWVDYVDHSPLPVDPNGHGTHVAGIIANTQVGTDKEWDGMAPGVNLVGVRVLDKNGTGTYETVIKGIQWAIKNQRTYNIRVINLSLLAAVQSPYWADPLDQAVMRAWSEGITVVTAAGNTGPNAMTIGVPGNAPYVITVGAFTDAYTPSDWSDDVIASFSSAGPTLDGFVKPDLVAPGAHMVSTMLPGSVVAREHDANRVTNDYFSMAGTSQAAAVVSGVAALIISHTPRITPDEVKYRLQVTSLPWVDSQTHNATYSLWQQGAGRVNAPDAVFGKANGKANLGMDIKADLAGKSHYEGFSYYDTQSGQFRLRNDDGNTTAGFGAWSGGFGAWSGGFGAWSGGFGAWSGGFGAWSGATSWDGGFGAWSGGFGAWSGGFGAWSGGFGAWSGGFGAWSGSEPWANTAYSDPAFVQNFIAGKPANALTSTTSVNHWVDEP
ncbi:MAG TPA: S8 family serine peptidase [Anaerolineaceae bacterium]|jgi:serine protease AprX